VNRDQGAARPAPACESCGNLIAGFRGRLIHVDGHGGVVRGLDHTPKPSDPERNTR
jgi:hypothetical protein